MICNNCGIKISDDSKFCYKCGHKTSSKYNNKPQHTKKICNRCGSTISNGDEVCDNCGNKITNINTNELSSTENKSTKYSSDENNIQNSNISEVDNSHIQNTEQETYNSQKSIPPVKTNKSLSSNKIIIMCTVFLIFVTIVALLTPDTDTTPDTNTQSDTSLDTNNTANTTEIQLTKTYTNEEEGLSFRYPEEWIYRDDLTDRESFILSLSVNIEQNYFVGMYIDRTETPYEGFEITDMISTFSNEETQSGYTIRDVSKIKIDGVDAIKASFDSKDKDTLIEYAYAENGNLYIITFSSPDYYLNEYEPVFDSIMESYKITSPTNSINQNTEDYGLSEEEALEAAQQFIDTHPLYERAVTGDVEYQPEDYDYSTEGLYKINLLTNEGEDRFMWVDKKTGSALFSLDGVNLITGEEFYNAMFVSAQNRDEIYFNGIKISDYLGSSVDDIYDDFGPPISGTDVDGKTYTTGNYMGYKYVDFIYDKDIESIEYIVGKPKVFTYKNVPLDKSRDELVELLGTPSYETPVDNDTEKPDNTALEFSMISYTLRFDFKSGYNDTYKIILYDN